jgi:tetratricopeptide (TPR) repeat protein
MKLPRRILTASALVAAFQLGSSADAQTRTTGGVRGKVVDEEGKGLDDVTLDMEFRGESRVKVTKTQSTDKNGGYVRMGLLTGRWRLVFSKPGYVTQQLDTNLSAGGFSELPDIVMKKAKAVEAAPAAKDEVVPTLPPESATMKDVYNKAVEASRAGDLDEAERLYREILEKLPDLGEIHYNLGHVYVRKKDLASAETAFRRAVELLPERVDSYLALSAVYASADKTQEAADLMTEAKEKFAEHAKFQYALGVAALNAGRSDEAAAAFRRTVELEPANPEPHFYLGSLAVGQNKVKDALAALDKYVSMSGQDPQNLQTAKDLLVALRPKK